jgi:chromosome segregation ATPase
LTEEPNNPGDAPLADDCPTDELPVLTELDVVEDPSGTIEIGAFVDDTARHARARDGVVDDTARHAAALAAGASDDSGRLPVARGALPRGPAGDEASEPSEHAARAARDAQIADKDATIASLEERLTATRNAVTRRDRAEAALRAELDRQTHRIAALELEIDDARRQVEKLRGAAEERVRDADTRAGDAEARAGDAEARARDAEMRVGDAEARTRDAEARARDAEMRVGDVEARAAKLAATERELEERRRTEQELLDWLVGEEQTNEALKADLEQSRERIAELEARGAEAAGRAADRAAEVEMPVADAPDLAARLDDDDTRELGMDVATAAARADALSAELESAKAGSEALVAELESLKARSAPLGAELEAAKERIASLESDRAAARAATLTLEAELEKSRAARAKLQVELEAARAAADAERAADGRPSVEVDPLILARQEAAALAAYIENRRTHWSVMEATLAERESELEVLRREAEQRERRQREAEETSRNERAATRRLKREIAELRTAEANRRRDESRSAREPTRRALESELEGLRLAIETLRHSEAEKDTRLAEAGQRQAALESELEETKARLAEAETSAARLEDLIRESGPGGASGAAGDGTSGRALEDGASSELPGRAPVLVCLTGDAPHAYRLTERFITIGRGPSCEIQIATQFVSREHARVEVGPERVDIVDLGSRNGVFINSVRVTREALHHGDLLTIGETQFRYLAE